MTDIIAVTDDMTALEKEKARAHNRKLMYKQMEKEDKKKGKDRNDSRGRNSCKGVDPEVATRSIAGTGTMKQ